MHTVAVHIRLRNYEYKNQRKPDETLLRKLAKSKTEIGQKRFIVLATSL